MIYVPQVNVFYRILFGAIVSGNQFVVESRRGGFGEHDELD
jgi:hypothetical protein